jgi:hypothetical protein
MNSGRDVLSVSLSAHDPKRTSRGIFNFEEIRLRLAEWETATHNGELKLLRPLVRNRSWGLPIVLAVFRR